MLNEAAFLFVKDVLDFWYSGYFFCFSCGETLKTPKRQNVLTKQLIESITIDNAVEIEELNKLAEKVQKPEEAADIIKQYQKILRTKRKGIISVANYQGKLFKRFKEKEKFIQMVGKSKIHKSTLLFKINVLS